MPKAQLSDLAAFVAVARHLSFRRAAETLNVSPSALSHALRQFEGRLKLRLLNRTTRSVALTDAGHHLLDRIGPALSEIEGAIDSLNQFRTDPVGLLRLNVPRQAARLVLIPLIARFTARFPGITVDIVAEDALVDVVSAGFDAGVRSGSVIAKDMISLPLGPPHRFAVIGAPSYLTGRTIPRHPKHLQAHNCIRYRYPNGRVYRWEFGRKREDLEVEVDGTLVVEDMDLVLDGVRAGLGLGYVFEGQAMADLAEGRLIRMLEDWCPNSSGFQLYYPARSNLSFALRAFIDFVKRNSEHAISGAVGENTLDRARKRSRRGDPT
jgi:DNA-binding transcriptional LysR family regulator